MLERLTAHWPLKLLALVLAYIVWVAVTGERPIVEDFTVPLDLQLPATRILAADAPTKVNVRLRGAESLMLSRERIRMEMKVDLQGTALGRTDVLLTRADLRGVPRGVNVEFIEPDRLSLIVDRRERRELPVEPVFLGQPPEGHEFYGAEIDPAGLTVEGPAAAVESLESLRTNPIRLDQRRAAFTINVAPVVEGVNVRVIGPRPVEVRVIIDTTPEERRLQGLGIAIVGGSATLEASPASAEVILRGPAAVLQSIRAGQLRLLADVTSIGAGRSVPLRAEWVDPALASRVSVKQIRPRTVSVRELVGRSDG